MSDGHLQLEDLPVDLLLAIIQLLPVQDLLSFLQVCRGFHALASSDYVWHSIDVEEPPLNLPPGKTHRAVSGPDLRKAWVAALRLERAWSNPASEPARMCRILHGDGHIVFQAQFLGSQWLITLSRAPNSSLSLTLWYIGTPHKEFKYACLDVPYASRFSAATRNEGSEVTIAVVMDPTRAIKVEIFSITLDIEDHDRSVLATPKSLCRIQRPHSEGTPAEIHVSGGLVVLAVAHFLDPFSPPAYRFIVYDTDNNHELTVSPSLPEHFTHVQFRLFPHHLVIAGLKQHERLALRTYDLADVIHKLQAETIGDDCVQMDLLSEDESDEVPWPADSDFTLSEGYLHDDSPHISALLFHAPPVSSPTRYGSASVYSFPAKMDSRCPSSHGTLPIHVFQTPASAASDIVCLGCTGQRSVWLERRWDADTFTLMRGAFSPHERKTALVGRLLPAHYTLPFASLSVQSMAFEESTGRVCLGLHTGELYILDLKDALSSVAVVVYIVVSTPCLLFQVVIPTAQTMDNELTMTVAWAVKT